MTASTRPRGPDGRFVKDRPSLARNTAQIPGAFGATLDAPITVAGLDWTPDDAHAWASPIGVALAMETAGAA